MMETLSKLVYSLAFYRWLLALALTLLMVLEVNLTEQTVLSLLCVIAVILL